MKNAYLYAVKLLSKRDYSKHKLKTKLESKGFELQDIESALSDVIDKGYLREENYATARAKMLMMKGLHPRYIKSKLAEESVEISMSQIDLVFKEYQITPRTQIEELLIKKTRSLDLSTLRDEQSPMRIKLIRYLLTKGHEPEDASIIFDEFTHIK